MKIIALLVINLILLVVPFSISHCEPIPAKQLVDENGQLVEQYFDVGTGAFAVRTGSVDKTTDSIKTVDYSHAEIHSGSHYFYRETHDVARNTSIEHLILTPDTTRYAHMTIAVSNISSTVVVNLFEGTTPSAIGTIETVRNRNRNVAEANTTGVYEGPTITSDGSLLSSFSLGTGRNQPGGGSRDSEELILKRNTVYLLRITEQNIEATKVNITFDWYEHTDKELLQ